MACAAATLGLAVSVTVAAQSVTTAHRVAGAADAAALAAADAWNGWIEADPCELAREVVEANGAMLEQCALDRVRNEVRVLTRARTMLGTVGARARAGPPES